MMDSGGGSSVGAEPGVRAEIGRVADGGELRLVFQPVFDLDAWMGGANRIVGFEALARFEGGIRPDVVFGAATRLGLRTDVELAAVRHALVYLGEFSPTPISRWPTLVAAGFGEMLSGLSSLRSLMVEVPEPALVDLPAGFGSMVETDSGQSSCG